MNLVRSVNQNGEYVSPNHQGSAEKRLSASSSASQIVTLAFLSENLPASLISEQLTNSLRIETQSPVMLVRFDPRANNGPTNRSDQVYLNGEFHMPPRLTRSEGGFYYLTLNVDGDSPSPAGIVSLVSQLRLHFKHVLLEVPALQRSTPWFKECLVRSDLSYLFLQANEEQVTRGETVAREAQTNSRNSIVQIKAVACLNEGESTDKVDALSQRVSAPMDFFVRECPCEQAPQFPATDLFRADVRRLAREIGGKLVGLALSSGAAKGFAHIGVIQVLEENDIEVDVVAGASMGAYVGSIWAHGNDGTQMERLAREMEGRWALWSLIDPVFPPRQGFLRGYAVKKRLMRTIGHSRFADLARPLRIVAGNLATLERVVFSSGEVATAVHASSAVPGICVPVTIAGETYIDGGIVDPLPVDVLREMGVGRVIAVDAIPGPDMIRAGLDAKRQPARHRRNGAQKLFRKLFPVNQQLNYFARGNLFEILMRSVYGAQIRVAEASCRLADVVLRPRICDDRWLDYRHPGKFIKLGREAAERHLDEIKTLTANKELNHERQSASEKLANIA